MKLVYQVFGHMLDSIFVTNANGFFGIGVGKLFAILADIRRIRTFSVGVLESYQPKLHSVSEPLSLGGEGLSQCMKQKLARPMTHRSCSVA